jgi:O-antigen ligase
MHLRFPAIALIFATILGGTIYTLHLQGLVTAPNEVYARFAAIGLFLVSFLILVWQKVKKHRFSWDDFYKNDTLIIASFTLLLVSFFFIKDVSYYLVALFGVSCLARILYTRKFYVPPSFFYFIIAYALLMFLGTIGTSKGFHFPDRIISFFVLPLSFCFFYLPRKTLLQIGEVFFKAGIIALLISLLYWFYNFLHLDADFTKWVFGKTGYMAQMTGWESQAGGAFLWELGPTKGIALHYSAYSFVNSWSYLFHPTTNSIVILSGLIVGFYLYYKKGELLTISKWDLLLYIIPCLLIIMLMQSRIGLAGFILIVGITGLYYLVLKTKYPKIALIIYFVIVGASLLLLGDKISGFAKDDIRSSYRKIAVSYIQENFWWGSGFNEQRLVLKQQAEKIKDILPENVYPHTSHPITHVHNQFLDDTVRYGILGFVVLIAMLLAIAYYAIKNRSYLLQVFLCFVLFFMWIESGEFMIILAFVLFFTAISESKKLKKNKI